MEKFTDCVTEMKDQMQSKENFTAGMVHDIRNPLQSMIYSLEFMKDNQQIVNDEELMNRLESSTNCAEFIISHVSNFLDLSKFETSKIELNPSPTDIKELGKKIVQMHMFKAENKNLLIELFASENVPELLNVDGQRLTQIMVNLVSNALKFTHVGGVTINIKFREIESQLNALKQDSPPIGFEDGFQRINAQQVKKYQLCSTILNDAQNQEVKGILKKQDLLSRISENEEEQKELLEISFIQQNPKQLNSLQLQSYRSINADQSIQPQAENNIQDVQVNQNNCIPITIENEGCIDNIDNSEFSEGLDVNSFSKIPSFYSANYNTASREKAKRQFNVLNQVSLSDLQFAFLNQNESSPPSEMPFPDKFNNQDQEEKYQQQIKGTIEDDIIYKQMFLQQQHNTQGILESRKRSSLNVMGFNQVIQENFLNRQQNVKKQSQKRINSYSINRNEEVKAQSELNLLFNEQNMKGNFHFLTKKNTEVNLLDQIKMDEKSSQSQSPEVSMNQINPTESFQHKSNQNLNEGVLLIEVLDTGIGIKPEKINDLFKPFSTADKSHHKQYGGTGLGLWFSKVIVELMGGSIECHSEGIVGQGSQFLIQIPVQYQNDQRIKSQEVIPELQDDQLNKSQGRKQLNILELLANEQILLIYQNKQDRNSLQKQLQQRLGHTTEISAFEKLVDLANQRQNILKDKKHILMIIDNFQEIKNSELQKLRKKDKLILIYIKDLQIEEKTTKIHERKNSLLPQSNYNDLYHNKVKTCSSRKLSLIEKNNDKHEDEHEFCDYILNKPFKFQNFIWIIESLSTKLHHWQAISKRNLRAIYSTDNRRKKKLQAANKNNLRFNSQSSAINRSTKYNKIEMEEAKEEYHSTNNQFLEEDLNPPLLQKKVQSAIEYAFKNQLNNYILIVEDDELLQVLYPQLFELIQKESQQNFEILQAYNGQEALKIFQEHAHSINLVITDFNMPYLSGPELTLKIRQFETNIRKTKCPIIGLTGDTSQKIYDFGYKCGMTQIEAKPISKKDIKKLLKQYLLT